MSVPRGLSPAEQAAWARLAQSVTPLSGRTVPSSAPQTAPDRPARKEAAKRPARASVKVRKVPAAPPAPALSPEQAGLDGHWERKLKAGRITPDLTLDLHGHSLDTAYARITSSLDQARAMGARVVLVIAGRERPVDPADRASKRGAIRAKLLDWLAAGPHADAIAAVRRAHRSHGGDGAVYLVLKRTR
ncbi:MAG: Smr/MutS family protein [Pseudomonadota bacterium]